MFGHAPFHAQSSSNTAISPVQWAGVEANVYILTHANGMCGMKCIIYLVCPGLVLMSTDTNTSYCITRMFASIKHLRT